MTISTPANLQFETVVPSCWWQQKLQCELSTSMGWPLQCDWPPSGPGLQRTRINLEEKVGLSILQHMLLDKEQVTSYHIQKLDNKAYMSKNLLHQIHEYTLSRKDLFLTLIGKIKSLHRKDILCSTKRSTISKLSLCTFLLLATWTFNPYTNFTPLFLQIY